MNRRFRNVTGLLCTLALSAGARGQLTNPGFEVPGPGGTFAGWESLGNVSAATDLVEEGSVSAKAFGRFIGAWEVSGVRQAQPASPGDVWIGEISVAHPSSDPLTGLARGIMNIEWRDSADQLISFDSVSLIDASDPTDVFTRHYIRSSPAPAGTVSTRILVGILQSPANETGSVRVDRASLALATGPEDPVQWTDTGSRIIEWAGWRWRVKRDGVFGPGPNTFSDSADNVWVDPAGRLHLRVTNDAGTWKVPEIICEQVLGHGDYIFQVEGRVDLLDANLVLGLFTWEYQTDYTGIESMNVANEFDIELARWGNPGDPTNAQWVAQPYTRPGNRVRYTFSLSSPTDISSHAFSWEPDVVRGRAWPGAGPEPAPASLFASFAYTGPDIPAPEAPRVHINFWLFFGNPPLDGQEHEVVLPDFTFVPLCSSTYCTTGCEGDADGNGSVDVSDVSYVIFRLGDSGPGCVAGDADSSGTVDVGDVAFVIFRLGSCATAPACIP